MRKILTTIAIFLSVVSYSQNLDTVSISLTLRAQDWAWGLGTTNGGSDSVSRATALATSVGAVTAVTAAKVVITGTITVNAAGTLTCQAAANAAVGTTSVLVGSTFVITEML